MWLASVVRIEMSIAGIGNPTPIQGAVLFLAGCVVTGRSRNLNPTKEQVEASQERGFEMLVRITNRDFGRDAQAWIEFLSSTDEDFGFTHPYGFRSTKRILEELGYTISIDIPEDC